MPITKSQIPTVIIRSFLLLDTLNIVGEIVMDYKRIKNQYFSNFPFTYSFPFLYHFLHLGPSATEYCSSIQSAH